MDAPATPWPATPPTPPSTSTSTLWTSRPPATTRSSTCSTPTPGCRSILRNAADLGLGPADGRRLRPARCSRTRRRATCSGRSPSSRAWSPRPPQLREPHRVARYLEDTAVGLPQVLRRLPGAADGRRGAGTDLHARPAAARRRPPGRCSPTACGCSASPRPSGCDRSMRAHEAGWAHADGALARAGLAAHPRRRQRPASRCCGRSTARKRDDGALEVGGVDVRDLRRRARLAGVRPRRGRLPGPRPRRSATRSAATTSSTPARRSSARRSPAGSPRRGSASTSAPAAS